MNYKPFRGLEALVILSFIITFVLVAHVISLDPPYMAWWSDASWTIASGAAAWRAFHVANQLESRARNGWVLIGTASFAWFAGMLVWDYHELIRNIVTPFPALSDIGYLLFPPFLATGLYCLRPHVYEHYSFKLLQIGKIGIVIITVLIAHLILFDKPLNDLHESFLYEFTALLYPVVYMSSFLFAVSIYWRWDEPLKEPVSIYLLTGFFLHAVTTSLYAYSLLGKNYTTGHYLDVSWLLAFAALYRAASLQSYKINHAEQSAGENHQNESKIKLDIDALLPVLGLLALIISFYAAYDEVTPDLIKTISPLLIVLVAFIALREWSSRSLDHSLAEQSQIAEAQYREIFNATNDAIFVHDAETGVIIDVNRRMTELYKCTRDQAMQYPIDRFSQGISPYSSKEALEWMTKAQKEGPQVFNWLARDLAGKLFWVEVSIRLAHIGKKTRLVVVVRDINKRVEAENALKESQEKYRLAMEVTRDGLWDWDIATGGVYYSPSWAGILGEEMIEHNYREWESRIHKDDKKRILNALESHLSGYTEIWQEEHRLLTKNGKWIWVLGRGQVVKRDSQGKPVRMIGTITDINLAKKSEELIWHQAHHDLLTSLPNRTLFHELLNQEIKHAHRDGKHLWLLFLDLDGFKEVNDAFGHSTGDELLVKVAERIQSTVREPDIVARLGGDEFVIILSNIEDPSYVEKIAAKLVDEIGEYYQIGEDRIFISVSIGITNYPDDADNSDDLLRYADQSMYAAKKKGRNRYAYFTNALQEAFQTRSKIANELRHALDNNEFTLHYQPIVNLESGDVYKSEALLRWKKAGNEIIGPETFIPIAEETGIIHDISSWVVNASLRQLSKWNKITNGNFQISINKSPVEFYLDRNKHDYLIECLNKYDLPGNCIVIEITEGLLLDAEERVTRQLLDYRDTGINVAIDDFGTGYSSLAYLNAFDIDYLKIDRTFVRNLEADSSAYALSEAIVVMAHKLGLKVIAEGIETEKQHNLLRDIGCDYGQGYYFSRALPADEFERLYIDRG